MQGLGEILYQITNRTAAHSEALERWRASPAAQEIDAQRVKNRFPACPICNDNKIVSVRNALGQTEWPPCVCYLSTLRESRRRYSGLPDTPVFLNGLDPNGPALESAIEIAHAYIKGFTSDWELAEPILTFQGEVGTGKSHLLLSIGWALLDQGVIVKYLFVPDWLAKLRGSFGESGPDPEDIYNAYDGAEVLLIDNMDGEHPTPWSKDILGRVIDSRYRNNQRLVVATKVRSWAPDARERLGDWVADRIFDTNSGKVKVVHTGETSYRTGQ